MKILLLVPPFIEPTQPSLALPSLVAFLKQNGFNNVIQKDLNIESYEMLLTKQNLLKYYRKMLRRFKTLEKKKSLSIKDQREYIKLSQIILVAPHTIKNIEIAKRILRDPSKFYNINEHSNAMKILDGAFRLISGEYQPLVATTINKHIIKIISSKRKNVFLKFFKQYMIPFILQEKPNLVGISITYRGQVIPGLTLAHLIKKENERIHVTMGGSFFTNRLDILYSIKNLFSTIDSFIAYEGEIALLKLITQLKSEGNLEEVPNLIYKKKKKIFINKKVSAPNINSLPPPDFDGLPFHLYFSPEPIIPLLTARGCYWKKCAFCTHWFSYSQNYCSRHLSLVLEDIRTLSEKYRVRTFYFVDETITSQRLYSLAKLLLNNNVPIQWFCDARLEKGFTANLCNFLAKAGCKMLIFGLESGCQRLLDLMEKGINAKTAEDVIRNCYNAGILVIVMTFIGFPTETREEALKTFKFLSKNENIIDFVACENFVLEKNSKVFKSPHSYGIIKIYKNKNLDAYNYEVNRGMSMLEVRKVLSYFKKNLKALNLRIPILSRGTAVLLGRNNIQDIQKPQSYKQNKKI